MDAEEASCRGSGTCLALLEPDRARARVLNMMKTLRPTAPLALGASLVLLTSGALVSDPVQASNASPAARVGHRLEAKLRPEGDPDGKGEAIVKLNKRRHRVCATITWQGIATPTAAHIHRASDDFVVVNLTGSVTQGSKCVTGVKKKVIKGILAHPKRYYVQVHNLSFPAGAIRGTLHRG